MSEDRTPRQRPGTRASAIDALRAKIGRWRVVVALLPIAVVAGLTYAAVQSPLLTAQSFTIKGADTLDHAALIEISGLRGESLLDLPQTEAQARLMEITQIKSVSISRTFPQKVTITVRERQPAAFWSINGREYVVDDEGYVLTAGVPSGPAPLIVEPDSTRVMGPGDRVHPDAVALALRLMEESANFLGQEVETLEYRQDIGVAAVFADGMRVTFGDQRSYEYKVAVLKALLDKLSAQGAASPRSVDLRYGERVTYD